VSPNIPPDIPGQHVPGYQITKPADMADVQRDADWHMAYVDGEKPHVLRAIGTNDLKRINAMSVERGYNKTLDEATVERLDEGRLHTVSYVVGEHFYADTKRVPVHMRVMLMLAMAGETEPEQHLLDMPMQAFNVIPILAKNKRDGQWEVITPGNRLMRAT
jgi:hypothetical protein